MRTLTKFAAALAALTVLGIAPSATAATPMPRDWVPASQLAPYRAIADRLQNVSTDPGSGYGLVTDINGISCIADPAGTGAMGYHYANGGLIFDNGVLDAATPEAVVYAPTQGGNTQVVALEYIVPKADWDADHTSAPELFAGHPFMVTDAPNRFGLPAFYSQHVWIGRGNPLGNLAMWNPAIHC
jgi:hypothetical protein